MDATAATNHSNVNSARSTHANPEVESSSQSVDANAGDDNDDDASEFVLFNTDENLHSIMGQGTLDMEVSSQPPRTPILSAFMQDEVYIVPPDASEDAAELVFTHMSSRYVHNSPKIAVDHELSFQYDKNAQPVSVIQRVNNILSRSEALEHSEECKVAMIKELQRWCKHRAWRRRPRKESHNVLQSRWVLKWKKMKDGRGIKARLVVQGFQDRQVVQNYAGTTSRWGQRLLLVLAVQFNWKIVSLGVSEAFLRGITFAELHKADPSEPLRQVQLRIPPGSGVLFRSLDGLEDFCEDTETLELLKPGFGLKDAPRLWNVALRRVLKQIGVDPISTDNQFYVKHDSQSSLILAISVHVDDLKMTGLLDEIARAQKILEENVDELKCEVDNFEHLGLQHYRHNNDTICVTQEHYAKELRTIPEADLRINPQEVVSPEVGKLYMSLLGGVAWLVQTRLDICVFVAALQRRLQNPRGQDVIALNRIVKYVQKKPLKLCYKKLDSPWRLIAISDSSYQAQDDDGLAMRSGLILLTNKCGFQVGDNQVQLLEYVSRKQTRVCRSTYSAELFSALDLIGMALNISLGLTEVLSGVQSAAKLSEVLEGGRNLIPLDCIIDARSVLDSVSQNEVKTPNDRVMLIHALKLREHLTRNQISRLIWVDTRDMTADALNKGSVSREAIVKCMLEAVVRIAHEPKILHAPKINLEDDSAEQ